jgi:methylase of polypeptide subunit release factors
VVSRADALLNLLRELKSRDYQFICVTPATHERVLARRLSRAPTPRDIFGWNRPFSEGQLEPRLLDLLRQADCVDQAGGEMRSRVRVASLGERLFLHSSFPTTAADAIFFGPDTYRFVRFVAAQLHQSDAPKSIVDMGAGSGAGGILAAGLAPSAKVTLVDTNPAALELAAINAEAAGGEVGLVHADHVPDGCDLVIANPPYMIDSARRTYRDGGSEHGGEIARDWVKQALTALVPGGTMLLYTGSAVVDGHILLLDRLKAMCAEAHASIAAEEIDPDLFGEELDSPAYADVERIAAVGIRITMSK